MKHISEFLFLIMLNVLAVVGLSSVDDADAQDNQTTTGSLGKNAPLFSMTPLSQYSLSKVLNDSKEVVDWPLSESVIAVKAELDKTFVCKDADCFNKNIGNAEIIVNGFMGNKYYTLAKGPASELYKFVHIPSEKWEGPAISIDVKFKTDPNKPAYSHTKSSMCNTYIELGKLYKCNITIK